MSYYVVKAYGLVCDVCEASEESVPEIDEPRKLAATRRFLATDKQAAHGPWVYRNGRDLCGACGRKDSESAAAARVNEQRRRSDRTGPVVLHRVDAASLLP